MANRVFQTKPYFLSLTTERKSRLSTFGIDVLHSIVLKSSCGEMYLKNCIYQLRVQNVLFNRYSPIFELLDTKKEAKAKIMKHIPNENRHTNQM